MHKYIHICIYIIYIYICIHLPQFMNNFMYVLINAQYIYKHIFSVSNYNFIHEYIYIHNVNHIGTQIVKLVCAVHVLVHGLINIPGVSK